VTVANSVFAKLSNGYFCVYSSATTDLVVDMTGFVVTSRFFQSVDPARLMDTRMRHTTIDGLNAGIGMRRANDITELVVVNRAGVPSNATSVVLNVTVTEATASGYVTVYPCGSPPQSLASNLNYVAGQTVANAVVSRIGNQGKVCIVSSAPTHLVVDVNSAHVP
jgi:hypothetical protein